MCFALALALALALASVISYDHKQFGASLTDNTSIIIYDCIMFEIQATGLTKVAVVPFSLSNSKIY